MKRIAYILILSALMMASCVRDPEVVLKNTMRGNVEALWQIIDEKYCFVEEKGLDWNGVLPIYQAKADSIEKERAESMEKRGSDYYQRALFDLMAQMLDTLQDGHVNLYSSFDVSRCSSWYEDYPSNFNSGLLTQYIGTDYKTAAGLTYNLLKGHEDIGYIRYSSFSDSFGTLNMYYVIKYFEKCRGMIIDVRNNGGGSLENAYKLASTFMKETTLVGYWQHKTGKGHQDFSPLEPLYVDSTDMTVKWLRPVIVLCNRRSYSATNMFVNAMRYAPNATIVGGRTGGGGGMPLSYELPNGWMVRFSSVRMTDRDKVSIENGVMPDEEVTLEGKDKDDLIERAIKLMAPSLQK